MIIIPDFSHHQKNNSLAMEYLDTSDVTIIILKATEGLSYKDPETINMIDRFMHNFETHCCCENLDEKFRVAIGLYHFCRLDNKDSMDTARERAEKEMRWYVKVVKDIYNHCRTMYPWGQVDLVPILDWEGNNVAQPNRDAYLLECVAQIYKEFGTAPVVYMSGAFTNSKEAKAVKEACPDVPLWVAHYNSTQPRVSTWKKWLGWQFTNLPFDMSILDDDAFLGYRIKEVGK